MRKVSEKLKIPFVEIAEGRGLSRSEVLDYLKWLRYYLDFCAKYNDPPRDSDSLPLFLQKLASKGQSVEQQKQAVIQRAKEQGYNIKEIRKGNKIQLQLVRTSY